MTSYNKIIPFLTCKNGKLMIPGESTTYNEEASLSLCHFYNDRGADAILIQDLAETSDDHEKTIYLIKHIAREIDIPIITGGKIDRLEDVKKYLYAGAQAVFLDVSIEDHIDLMKESADRFGNEKIYAYLPDIKYLKRVEEFLQLGASIIIIADPSCDLTQLSIKMDRSVSYYLFAEQQQSRITSLLETAMVNGVILTISREQEEALMDIKHHLRKQGISVELFESAVPWNDFKLNSDGLIPVIVQDYQTSAVLMLAYMNQEAFEQTINSGLMTYFSRSRQSLWVKGETSGHTQYVKSLELDCDQDTLLAKVKQIGAACHTGANSCFYQNLVKKEYLDGNPLKVFEEVYTTILNRKQFPKEGSYTNYLFDKGIDKILKKLGEEATEIVIAAKNPNTEEIKYEISDFLYHMMVLMAEKRISWEEITKELSNRS